MTESRALPVWVSLLSVLGCFAAGPALGIGLARLLAPSSLVADAVGLFVFALAFALGLQAWLGWAVLAAVAQLLRRALSGQPLRQSAPQEIPSGSFVFVPISTAFGFFAGVAVGIVAEETSLVSALAIYTGAGAAYGAAVWQLARGGHLPFPEPG